jgi:hypothetical protein
MEKMKADREYYTTLQQLRSTGEILGLSRGISQRNQP